MRKTIEWLTNRAGEEESKHLSYAIAVQQSVRQGQIFCHEGLNLLNVAFDRPMLIQLFVMELVEFRAEMVTKSS